MSARHDPWRETAHFPFVAVSGQGEAKLALTLAAICPGLGGVLLCGEKGTAKSTLARGLAGLLPDIGRTGCFVDLPLGVGEDRLAGCIDLEQAVARGRIVCQPGLLARANGGVLYVDEVNLLPDHITDMLLGAAASGRFRLEREGLTAEVESRFVLLGSMNPEEGALRPQLLDRFGLCVEVAAVRDVPGRVALLRDLEAFEADPRAFVAARGQQREALVRRLARACRLYPVVRLSEPARERAVALAVAAGVAGQRAEILLSRAARAFAAWENQADAGPDAVTAVAELVLRHRRREVGPPPQHRQDSPPPPGNETQPPRPPRENPAPGEQRAAGASPPQESARDAGDGQGEEKHVQGAASARPLREEVFEVGEAVRLKPITVRRDRLWRKAGSGRRTQTKTRQRQGRTTGARTAGDIRDLALDATLRAAAPRQLARRKGQTGGPVVRLRKEDLREKVREKRVCALVVLVVDASSSMGAARRMREAKGAVLSFLLDAYQRRERVALVAFRGGGADVLLPPTGSLERAYRLLEELPTGGKTPLAHGLLAGYRVIETELRKNPSTIPLLLVITDGRTNVPLSGGKPLAEALDMGERIARDDRIRSIVVDTEPDHATALGLAGRLAEAMKSRHAKVGNLQAEALHGLFRLGLEQNA